MIDMLIYQPWNWKFNEPSLVSPKVTLDLACKTLDTAASLGFLYGDVQDRNIVLKMKNPGHTCLDADLRFTGLALRMVQLDLSFGYSGEGIEFCLLRGYYGRRNIIKLGVGFDECIQALCAEIRGVIFPVCLKRGRYLVPGAFQNFYGLIFGIST